MVACEFCNREFYSKQTLKRHIGKSHPDEPGPDVFDDPPSDVESDKEEEEEEKSDSDEGSDLESDSCEGEDVDEAWAELIRETAEDVDTWPFEDVEEILSEPCLSKFIERMKEKFDEYANVVDTLRMSDECRSIRKSALQVAKNNKYSLKDAEHVAWHQKKDTMKPLIKRHLAVIRDVMNASGEEPQHLE